VVARQRAGVDVKVIMSQHETAGFLELLQAAGLDVVNRVKLQNNVHNAHVAEYFQAIFPHDWDHLAQQHTTDD